MNSGEFKKLVKNALKFKKHNPMYDDGLWLCNGLFIVHNYHDMYWQYCDEIVTDTPVNLSFKQLSEVSSLYQFLTDSANVSINIGEEIEGCDKPKRRVTISVEGYENYTFVYNASTIHADEVINLINAFVTPAEKSDIDVCKPEILLMASNPKSIILGMNILDTKSKVVTSGIVTERCAIENKKSSGHRVYTKMYRSDQETPDRYFVTMCIMNRK